MGPRTLIRAKLSSSTLSPVSLEEEEENKAAQMPIMMIMTMGQKINGWRFLKGFGKAFFINSAQADAGIICKGHLVWSEPFFDSDVFDSFSSVINWIPNSNGLRNFIF